MLKLIDEIKKTSGDVAHRGWAESKGGNISLRLNKENYAFLNGFQPKSDWVKLPETMPEFAGERFLVTGTDRFFRNIEVFPEKISVSSSLTQKVKSGNFIVFAYAGETSTKLLGVLMWPKRHRKSVCV